ncbi:hypothetical protein WN943_027848 [Citrus x changshan-huyou]
MGLARKESTFSDEDGFEDEDVSELNEEVSESESDSEGEEDVKLAEPSKQAVYNRDGLEEKLQDISWPENAGWIHKLAIDIDQEQEVDVNDDLKREASFYTQALEGTRQAFEKLQSMGLPFLRPADYYAEMVKSDAHMEKVKRRLLSEQKEIEEAAERKKAREAKKLAKEIQVQKTKERAKQKKEEIESVKKWRKQRQQSGFAGEVDKGELDLAFEGGKSFERSNKKRPGVSPGDRSGGKARKSGGGDSGKGKKKKNRDFRNSKFGFGGKKSMKKQNTSDTTDDLRGFSKGDGAGNKRRKSQSQFCQSASHNSASLNLAFDCSCWLFVHFISELLLDGASNYPLLYLAVQCCTSEKMLDSAVDWITEAASNSIFIFCFCNLIIVMILMGSKYSSVFDQESEEHAPVLSINSCAYSNKQETISIHSFDGNKKSMAARELSTDLQEEHADDQEEERNFENSESKDDDDELRRRFEEFIEKVNRGWKEEKLRTYGLV